MMTIQKLGKVLVGAGSAVLALAVHSALAQEVIQEVIVTAQKREQSLQTTPIAISAFSGEALKERGITDFKGIAESSPSISFANYPNSSNTLTLYMRGQGVSDPAQIAVDGSVGIYEDGFYIARPQFVTFDLADIERVEVLRGPQGTLYGRNTTGGAVNLISKKPTGEFGFKEDVDAGSYNYFRSLTAVNLPAWHGLSTKITVLDSRKDGFVKNLGPSNDYDLSNQRAGRIALHWENSGAFTADYFFETARMESTPSYFETAALDGIIPGYVGSGRPNKTTYRAIDLPLSVGRFNQNGLTLTWNLSDALTIKSLTGYRTAVNNNFQDYAEAFTDPSLGAFGNPALSFTSYDAYTDHQFTQELQAIGDVYNHRLKYVAGLYYFKEGGNHFETVTIGLPLFGFAEEDHRNVRAYSKSQAVYGQATWTPPILNDKLEVTVGARYTKDDKSARRDYEFGIPPGNIAASETGASISQSFTKFNPAVTVAYNWSEDVNTYLRVATGYKAGGSLESTPLGSFGRGFGPEKIVTYELGLKSYAWDRRFRFNTALFQSKFTDMQLVFTADPNNSAIGLGLNAGKATVNGAEVEMLILPIDDLSLTISYTYLDAKIDQVLAPPGTIFDPAVNPSSPYQVGQDVTRVFSLPYSPKNAFNVAANYTFLRLTSSELSAHFDYRWQGFSYATATTGPAIPGSQLVGPSAYGVLNGRLTWSFDLKDASKARISLWSKNLTDKRHAQYVIGGGSFIAAAGVPAGWTRQDVAWAEPRTFGVNLVYEFGAR